MLCMYRPSMLCILELMSFSVLSPSSLSVLPYHYNALGHEGLSLGQITANSLCQAYCLCFAIEPSQQPWRYGLWLAPMGAGAAGCRGRAGDAGEGMPGVCLSIPSIFSFNSLGCRKLKTHLQHVRWRGTKSVSPGDTDKSCARCGQVLGLLLNRGTACRGCSHRVCSECRVFPRRTRVWRCTVCYEDR